METKKRGRTENLKPWKPGHSGNPGGRPKKDISAQIAQAVFEKNAEAIEKAMLKALKRGNPKVFTVLADRGFGKLSQKAEVPEVVDLAEMLAQARERANRMGRTNGAVGKAAE